MRRTPGQNPNLHAPRQSAGYSRGSVIGDGARARYRPPELPAAGLPCDRCHQLPANILCPKPDDPTFERPGYRFCSSCAEGYHAWRREKGLLP